MPFEGLEIFAPLSLGNRGGGVLKRYFLDRFFNSHGNNKRGEQEKELLFFNTLFFFLYKIDLLILLRIKKMLISKRVSV